MKVAARVTAKGQVTIPAVVRKALALDVGDEVIFEMESTPGASHAQIRRAADFLSLAGSVPVPPEWADADWSDLRSAAWTSQAKAHDDRSDPHLPAR